MPTEEITQDVAPATDAAPAVEAEAVVEQIINLIASLSPEDQINLLGLLNGQFNTVAEEAKYSPEASDARAAEMANVF